MRRGYGSPENKIPPARLSPRRLLRDFLMIFSFSLKTMMDWCDTMGSTNPKDDGRVVSLIATFRLLSAVSLSLSVAPMLRDAKCENQQRHGDVYGAGTMAPHYGRIIKSIREVYPFLFFFSFLTKGFNNLTVYVYRDVRARPKGGGSNS